MQQETSPRLTLAFIHLMVVAAVAYLGVVVLVSPPARSQGQTQARTQEVAGVSARPVQPEDAAAVIQGQSLQRALEDALYRETYTTPTPTIPRATRTLDVHIGPGDAYAVLGLIPSEGRIDVVGRNDKGDWLAVVFTPGSNFHGWIPAAATTGLGDVMRLPVVLPSSLRPR